jgi:hypothetical protein
VRNDRPAWFRRDDPEEGLSLMTGRRETSSPNESPPPAASINPIAIAALQLTPRLIDAKRRMNDAAQADVMCFRWPTRLAENPAADRRTYGAKGRERGGVAAASILSRSA